MRHRVVMLLQICCLQFCWLPPLFAAEDRGLFYRVDNGDSTLYLLGSIHVANAEFYPLRAVITDAFNAADALAVEADVTAIDPQQMAAWMQQHGFYPPSESLRDHLQPATWRRLLNFLQAQHIDPASIIQQKPGLVVTTLSMLQMQQQGMSPEFGIDEQFLEKAHSQHKSIVELESVEQQLTLLSTLPNADLLLNQTLDESAEIPLQLEQLSRAWKDGDAVALEKFLLEDDISQHPEYKPLFEQLYTRRNASMTLQIKGFLQSRKKYFVVVGAAHLVGNDGIVSLLKKSGYQIEQR